MLVLLCIKEYITNTRKSMILIIQRDLMLALA